MHTWGTLPLIRTCRALCWSLCCLARATTRLDLDVAIVGFPKCGTHSLGRLLRRFAIPVRRNASGLPNHRIDTEDDFFVVSASAKSSPNRQNFNNRDLDSHDYRHLLSAKRFAQLTPAIAYYPDSLEALTDSPSLKIVAVVRDPVEQFVSFYKHFRGTTWLPPLPQLAESVLAFRRRFLTLPAAQRPIPKRQPNSVFEFVQIMLYYFIGRFSEPVQYMRRLFGKRLLVVHLDEFTGRQEVVSRSVSALLDFFRFQATNHSQRSFPASGRRRGTTLMELCGGSTGSETLKRTLLEMLSAEYAALYSHNLGAPFAHLMREPCEAPRTI